MIESIVELMKDIFLVIAFLFAALFVVFLIIAFGWFLVWTLLVRRFRFVRELFMIKDRKKIESLKGDQIGKQVNNGDKSIIQSSSEEEEEINNTQLLSKYASGAYVNTSAKLHLD